ncbi:MAG: gliding motility-associated C-terminal domain-containing protein [Bacteroidaceae bacterium]|nr:gliding motility-associated C-terminal domain-containing protein [Bacteroidaceae bacterium]
MRQILFFILAMIPFGLLAQTSPSVNPSGTYTTGDGEETDDATNSMSAPVTAHFSANPSNVGDYSARYEWKIWKEGEAEQPLLHRFEEEIDYVFNESGSYRVQLYATFILGNDTIPYPTEQDSPIIVSVSNSSLDFPNAISPNDDGWNDKLCAKDGYQSIVDFEAAVFNRWGKKLYSWKKLDGYWDGKYNGRVVSDGVYFLVVNAKGADGRKYHIRKAITVISGNNKKEETGGEE